MPSLFDPEEYFDVDGHKVAKYPHNGIVVKCNFPGWDKPYEAFYIRNGEVWQAQLGETVANAVAALREIMKP